MGTQSHRILMHRYPSEAPFWCRNDSLGWSSDSESRVTRFDSRLAQCPVPAQHMQGVQTANVWCPHSTWMVCPWHMCGVDAAKCVVFTMHLPHVRITGWACQSKVVGMWEAGWDMVGDTLGMVSDGVGIVGGKIAELRVTVTFFEFVWECCSCIGLLNEFVCLPTPG